MGSRLVCVRMYAGRDVRWDEYDAMRWDSANANANARYIHISTWGGFSGPGRKSVVVRHKLDGWCIQTVSRGAAATGFSNQPTC